MPVEQTIQSAKKKAEEILAQSQEIRADFEAGHPNTSSVATAEGAIQAMEHWMEADVAAEEAE